MDENRFIYKQHYNAPLMIGEAFDGNKKLTVQEMVELLNEQQATITELEKNFDDLVDWTNEIAKRNVVLDEEIGELQQDNAKWRRKCLDLLVIIRTELLPRISDDEVKRLQKLIDDD